MCGAEGAQSINYKHKRKKLEQLVQSITFSNHTLVCVRALPHLLFRINRLITTVHLVD